MKRLKYGNKKCIYKNIKFDSLGERNRFIFLQSCVERGEISRLTLQPKFDLNVSGVLVCRYIGDFSYDLNGENVIEDYKGVITAIFRIKFKLMKAIHNIDIRTVKSPTENITFQ